MFKSTEQGISLSIYRITFGLLMCFSLVRFMYKGWVEACYITPELHFTFQYFHWIKPFESATAMYFVIITALIAAFCVAIGFAYRFFILLFLLLFTYLELISQSWYLNHYYFVAIVAFLLCCMPADRLFSVRSFLKKDVQQPISILFTTVLKLQISIVYFFAGLAKINSDWLFNAMPLNIWLKAKIGIPIIGDWLAYSETAYLFSYTGMLYDLTIPFLLWNKRTRPFAFVAVIGFHIMTALLFKIGMFPWIMIVGSLIFITDEEWQRIFHFLKIEPQQTNKILPKVTVTKPKKWLIGLFVIHFIIQVILPHRYLFYKIAHNENQLWTERHYRFAWNVMLIEKAGNAVFKVKDNQSGRIRTEYPSTHLNAIQEKQMSFQVDMIWQYAQFLKKKYEAQGITDISIYVENWIAFNGRPSQLFLPKDLDILTVSEDGIYDKIVELKKLF